MATDENEPFLLSLLPSPFSCLPFDLGFPSLSPFCLSLPLH